MCPNSVQLCFRFSACSSQFNIRGKRKSISHKAHIGPPGKCRRFQQSEAKEDNDHDHCCPESYHWNRLRWHVAFLHWRFSRNQSVSTVPNYYLTFIVKIKAKVRLKRFRNRNHRKILTSVYRNWQVLKKSLRRTGSRFFFRDLVIIGRQSFQKSISNGRALKPPFLSS